MTDRPPPAQVRLASRWGRVALYLSCAACVALAVSRLLDPRFPTAALLAGPLLLLCVVALGVFVHESGVFARPLLSVVTARPEVAITIDDGPDPVCTPAMLDALDARGQRATFFVIGERAERHAEILRQIALRGHAVANHSLRHSWATTFTPVAKLVSELRRTSEFVLAATGRKPTWFRAPVGLHSPRVSSAASAAGLQLVGWSATARDGVDFTSPRRSLSRLARGLAPGAILVIHDARPGGPALLAQLLDLLDARKLRSVTLDELVRGGE